MAKDVAGYISKLKEKTYDEQVSTLVRLKILYPKDYDLVLKNGSLDEKLLKKVEKSYEWQTKRFNKLKEDAAKEGKGLVRKLNEIRADGNDQGDYLLTFVKAQGVKVKTLTQEQQNKNIHELASLSLKDMGQNMQNNNRSSKEYENLYKSYVSRYGEAYAKEWANKAAKLRNETVKDYNQIMKECKGNREEAAKRMAKKGGLLKEFGVHMGIVQEVETKSTGNARVQQQQQAQQQRASAPAKGNAGNTDTATKDAAPARESAGTSTRAAAPARESAANTGNAAVDAMIRKIEYMNSRNGASRSIDAVGTAQKLYELYGENAGAMLDVAMNSPREKYSQGAGQEFRTSREAVQHLANMDKEQAQDFAANMLGDRAKSQNTNTDNEVAAKPNIEKFKEDMLQQFPSNQGGAFSELQTGGDKAFEGLQQAVASMMSGNNDQVEESIQKLVMALVEQYGFKDLSELNIALNEVAQERTAHQPQVETQVLMAAGATGKKRDNAKVVEEPSAEEKKRQEDEKMFEDMYKNDPKKFKKAKEGYKKALEGDPAGAKQAQYYLDIIEKIETKDQMAKDKAKADKKAEKEARKLQKKQRRELAGKSNNPIKRALDSVSDYLMAKEAVYNKNDNTYDLHGYEGKDPYSSKKLTNGIYKIEQDKDGNMTIKYKSDKNKDFTTLDMSQEEAKALSESLKEAAKKYASEKTHIGMKYKSNGGR